MSSSLKILYVHGYLGSAHGRSSELIKNEFVSRGIPIALEAPGFKVTNPGETKERIISLVKKKQYDYYETSCLFHTLSLLITDKTRILYVAGVERSYS